jgi:ATP-dependent Clp protease protease subunit
MIHQPSGGYTGQATDISIHAEEILRVKKELTQIYVDHNTKGKTFDELAKDMERDNFLTAKECIEYGLCDKILNKRD